jgi:hypothetical protein
MNTNTNKSLREQLRSKLNIQPASALLPKNTLTHWITGNEVIPIRYMTQSHINSVIEKMIKHPVAFYKGIDKEEMIKALRRELHRRDRMADKILSTLFKDYRQFLEESKSKKAEPVVVRFTPVKKAKPARLNRQVLEDRGNERKLIKKACAIV